MQNNFIGSKLLLLTSLIGTVNCMENELPAISQKIGSRFESQEQFITRTEKLVPMYHYNKPKNYEPKIQFNALGKKGVLLECVIDHDTRELLSNRITILNEDRTPLLRWDLKTKDVVAAAISCDGNMLATIHEYRGKDKDEAFWNLWKISAGMLKTLNRVGEKKIIIGPGWRGSDIIPESIDFNKQGDEVIVWGIQMQRALTPRHYKIYSLSGVNEDKIVETIE